MRGYFRPSPTSRSSRENKGLRLPVGGLGLGCEPYSPAMKTDRSSFQNPRERHAFTLTELLVIVGVVALILALQLPAYTGTDKRMRIVQCRSNLKQFASAMHIYGNEYNDRLPSSVGGFWAWDIPAQLGPFVERTGANWRVMFCPGTGPLYTDADNRLLYEYGGSYRVTGYANTFGGTINASERNTTLSPQPIQVSPGTFFTPSASERVLLADATISHSGTTNRNLVLSWIGIGGGFYLPHRSPHLDEANRPVGGNVGMLDGHVGWRRFNEIWARTPIGLPIFWW
jgi:prepilin-type processing-associated H-X9-DG protein